MARKVILLALLFGTVFCRQSPQTQLELSKTLEELETSIQSLEEVMECGDEPAVSDSKSVWKLAAHRYCKMSKGLTTKKAFVGSLMAVLNTVLYATGVGQTGNLFQSIGSCFGALGCAIVGDIKKANEFGADALDFARGTVDPSVAVSKIANDVTTAAASSVWSCIVSVVTAYEAFRLQADSKFRVWAFSNGYGSKCASEFPTGCAMPKYSENPFLQMITQDSGCPHYLTDWIEEDHPIYWHELTQRAADTALQNPGIIIKLATRAYGRTVRTLTDVTQRDFFSLVAKPSEVSEFATDYFSHDFSGPLPLAASPVLTGLGPSSGLNR